jgi:hypothetical protein
MSDHYRPRERSPQHRRSSSRHSPWESPPRRRSPSPYRSRSRRRSDSRSPNLLRLPTPPETGGRKYRSYTPPPSADHAQYRGPPATAESRPYDGSRTKAFEGASSSSSSIPDVHVRDASGIVKEYINDQCGILELPKTADGAYPSVFFHAGVVHVANPAGNPYGPPVRLTPDLVLKHGINLQESLPIGTNVAINAGYVQSRWVTMQATAVWPKTATTPTDVRPPSDHKHHLEAFHNRANPDLLVSASIHGLNSPKFGAVKGSIWEVKDAEFGVIQIKFAPPEEERLFVLFHREDVYLPDGIRAVSHPFFKDKPLSVIVSLEFIFYRLAHLFVLSVVFAGYGRPGGQLERQVLYL